jgi:predicted nucleic acid-binding protein
MTMSPEAVIIDASIAIAHLIDGLDTQSVRKALAEWTDAGVALLVPPLFWIEVSNVLMRRYAQPPEEIVEDFVNLDDLGMRTVDIDRATLLLALDQMARFGLSAYDAVYLALALATAAPLATLDKRLAAAAGEHGLLLAEGGSKRLSERSAANNLTSRRASGWAQSAVVGAYIARLRRELAG